MTTRKRKNENVTVENLPQNISKKIKIENDNTTNDEIDDAYDPVWCLKKAQEEKPSRQCPYLDTIDR